MAGTPRAIASLALLCGLAGCHTQSGWHLRAGGHAMVSELGTDVLLNDLHGMAGGGRVEIAKAFPEVRGNIEVAARGMFGGRKVDFSGQLGTDVETQEYAAEGVLRAYFPWGPRRVRPYVEAFGGIIAFDADVESQRIDFNYGYGPTYGGGAGFEFPLMDKTTTVRVGAEYRRSVLDFDLSDEIDATDIGAVIMVGTTF